MSKVKLNIPSGIGGARYVGSIYNGWSIILSSSTSSQCTATSSLSSDVLSAELKLSSSPVVTDLIPGTPYPKLKSKDN